MIARLSQLHENEQLLAAAQSKLGRLILWLMASLLMYWHEVIWLMPVALALVIILPEQRRIVLSMAAIGTIVVKFLDRSDIEISAGTLLPIATKSAIILILLFVAYFVARNFSRLPVIIKRVPVIFLHLGIWCALILSSIVGAGIFSLGPFLAWRLSYLFSQARLGKVAGTSFHDHLFYLMPVFGGTSTPYGKGLEYLARHEATDAAGVARAQLAGMKLLVLAVLWTFALRLMDGIAFGHAEKFFSVALNEWSLNVPRLADLMQSDLDIVVPLAWVSVYLELIRITLVLAIAGHVIIGCLRLVGFNVFRNTYKPLLAESVVDFWGRYYFYFKELLVDIFFYPAFLSCGWAGKKLRLFIAVFAAAFAGNMYFHFLLRYDIATSLELASLWAELGPRLIYCGLLAFGIWVSMLRQEKRRAEGVPETVLARLRRIAGVWTFFGVINIWNIGPPELDIAERFQFAWFLCFM